MKRIEKGGRRSCFAPDAAFACRIPLISAPAAVRRLRRCIPNIRDIIQCRLFSRRRGLSRRCQCPHPLRSARPRQVRSLPRFPLGSPSQNLRWKVPDSETDETNRITARSRGCSQPRLLRSTDDKIFHCTMVMIDKNRNNMYNNDYEWNIPDRNLYTGGMNR